MKLLSSARWCFFPSRSSSSLNCVFFKLFLVKRSAGDFAKKGSSSLLSSEDKNRRFPFSLQSSKRVRRSRQCSLSQAARTLPAAHATPPSPSRYRHAFAFHALATTTTSCSSNHYIILSPPHQFSQFLTIVLAPTRLKA